MRIKSTTLNPLFSSFFSGVSCYVIVLYDDVMGSEETSATLRLLVEILSRLSNLLTLLSWRMS